MPKLTAAQRRALWRKRHPQEHAAQQRAYRAKSKLKKQVELQIPDLVMVDALPEYQQRIYRPTVRRPR